MRTEIVSESDKHVNFKINGKSFVRLNNGPHFKINEATSFFVYCGCHLEIERMFTELSHEGSILMPLQAYPWSKKYAWVKDKYGVSWQILPIILESLVSDPVRDPKVEEAFLKMKKIDIALLMKA